MASNRFYIPNANKFLEAFALPFAVLRGLCERKYRWGHAEFLTRRQEEYQGTLCDLWVMYGRVTESAQENQPTQDLELLMLIMNSRVQSLAKLNGDFDYQGTTEESSITQNSLLSSGHLARNSACPHQYFRSHSLALLQQGEQTFEKFIYIWNMEEYRND